MGPTEFDDAWLVSDVSLLALSGVVRSKFMWTCYWCRRLLVEVVSAAAATATEFGKRRRRRKRWWMMKVI